MIGLRRESSSPDLVADIADSIEWRLADLWDMDSLLAAVAQVDVVIHTAGYIGADRDKLYNINVEGTANLINACLAQGVRRVIYTGSNVALGGPREVPNNETHYWSDAPVKLDYGYSKHLGEQEVWRGAAEGLEVAVILPGYVHGEHQWLANQDVYKPVYAGYGYYPVGSNGAVSVHDVVDMLMLLTWREELGEQARYICSAQNVTHEHLVKTIGKEMGKKLKYRALTLPFWKRWIMRFLQKTGLRSDMDMQFILLAQMPLLYDNRKSIEELGFSYRSIDDTIKDATRLFLAYKAGQ